MSRRPKLRARGQAGKLPLRWHVVRTITDREGVLSGAAAPALLQQHDGRRWRTVPTQITERQTR